MTNDGKAVIALTLPQLKALLAKAREHDERAYLLFLLIVCHGLRISEALALKQRNFETVAGVTYLTVQRLKGSLKTRQPLISDVTPLDEATAVPAYLARCQDSLFTWGRQYADRMMKRYCLWASIPPEKSHLHCLKHTLGILMRQNGAKLEEIQVALGHARIDSTIQYLRVTSDEVNEARSRAFTAPAVMAATAGGD